MENKEKMILITALKIVTNMVMLVIAYASIVYAPKQKETLSRNFFIGFALVLALGVVFTWV